MLKAQLVKVKATIADKQKAMEALHKAAHEKGLTKSKTINMLRLKKKLKNLNSKKNDLKS